jgi:hypothetical protein
MDLNITIPHAFLLSWRAYARYTRDGRIINPYDGVSAVRIDEHRHKQSVDDGGFTPGKYRVNPYSVGKETIEIPSHDVFTSELDSSGRTEYVRTVSGPIGAGFFTDAAISYSFDTSFNFGNLPQQVLQRAVAKVAEAKIGAGENILELKETLNTLRSPFKQFREFLESADHRRLGLLNKLLHYRKSGKWVGSVGLTGKDAAAAAAGAWMELRFGLRPLMYSIQDIIDLANAQASVFDKNKIRSAGSHLRETNQQRADVVSSAGGVTFKATLQMTDIYDAFASVQYKQEFDTPTWDEIGASPRFWPELFWEMTRASFAVDWWFSVGNWLGSFRVKPGFTILGNTVGEKVTRTVTGKTSATRQPLGTYEPSSLDLGSRVTKNYDRLVNQSLPLTPLLTMHLPDLYETVDSLSLILQHTLLKIKR